MTKETSPPATIPSRFGDFDLEALDAMIAQLPRNTHLWMYHTRGGRYRARLSARKYGYDEWSKSRGTPLVLLLELLADWQDFWEARQRVGESE